MKKMFTNILVSNYNPIGTEAVKKAKLTKGMWLLIIINCIVFPFFLLYSKIPILSSNITLSSTDLKNGFFVWLIFNVVLISAFALPDIIGGFRNKDDLD